MENRLGHDFSQVRIHDDERANSSANSLGANAYTIGSHIVFGAGKADLKTQEGKERLAHELTHVVQQRLGGGQVSPAHDFEAQRIGAKVAAGQSARVTLPVAAGSIQMDKKNPLDEKAKAIIAIAKDDTKKAEVRGVEVVQAIINEYYSADKPLVDSVVFDNSQAGSGVKASQVFSKTSKPEESTGIIYVGDTFLGAVNETHFARRVLQVGHEIEHIHQWREGLAGGHKKNEREFLAFYHEATLPEKPGTGLMVPGTRVVLIDGALGNFYCMDATKQKEHATKQKELVDLRASIISAGTKAKGPAPTTCKPT
jgi:hypothetical protein